MKDLGRRLPATLFMVLGAWLAINHLPDLPFALLVFAVISIAAWEFQRLCRPLTFSMFLTMAAGLLIGVSFFFDRAHLAPALVGAMGLHGLFLLFRIRDRRRLDSFVRDFGISLSSVLYLYLPLFFLFSLRRLDPAYLLFLLFVIAVGDSAAYFIGSRWGKKTIYPLASPRKTLAGLLAAVPGAALAGWLSTLIFPFAEPVGLLVVVATAALLGLFSQLADPLESLFKRAADRKDSGTLLAGHGGVLDRVDSYILCAPLLEAVILLCW